MRLYYDMHIHSALSPCGDEDMTPNNIVNMAMLLGLDIISVTDHNSCRNVRAVMEAAHGKVRVISGMEITTSEEVHVLCYFKDIEAAEDMGRLVEDKTLKIKNETEIFGRQLIMDSEDNVVGEVEHLLVNATSLDIYEVAEEVKRRGGIFVPAHIDKASYSVFSNLGFLPPDLPIDGVEITAKNLEKLASDYTKIPILTSSDAHYLENIAERERFFDTDDKITNKFLQNLCKI